MSRSEGSLVRLEELAGLLRDNANGASFVDVIEAASAVGIPLRAVFVGRDRLPSQPLIAHLRSPKGDPVGHFLFLRPVEKRGRQYQLIDPPNYPRVIEEKDLLEHPLFSGWVLVRRPWLTLHEAVGYGLIAFGTVGLVLSCLRTAPALRSRPRGPDSDTPQ